MVSETGVILSKGLVFAGGGGSFTPGVSPPPGPALGPRPALAGGVAGLADCACITVALKARSAAAVRVYRPIQLPFAAWGALITASSQCSLIRPFWARTRSK